MNEVWLVETYGYDHGNVLFVCGTEELAMEYLNEMAKKKAYEMSETRRHIMNDEIGPQNYYYKKSQADMWIVEWLNEYTFQASAGLDTHRVKRYIVRKDSPTEKDIKDAF
jgi:hypothetical protein